MNKEDTEPGGSTEESLRFFTGQKKEKRASHLSEQSNSLLDIGDVNLDILSLNQVESDELNQGTCLTLRLLQNACSCGKKKGLWEPSQGNVFKSHEVEETKYPTILKVLEFWNLSDSIFVATCLASIFLFFFSVGFMMQSKILWGVIHINNALYTIGLFAQWLRILITSKYSKMNQGYTKTDVIMALITVFPIDLILLVIYSLNKQEVDTTVDNVIISCSRLNYLFRVYYISKYFATWENQLIVGDFIMFLIRTTLYSTFLIHIYGCIWHRIACKSFSLKHFLMSPDEATRDICEPNSWIQVLLRDNPKPLLTHPSLNVLGTHYLVSLYWATTVAFGLGLGDIKVYLTSDLEIIVTALTQITAWIFTLAVVSGTLTSLFVEGDTERESYLTRRFAIKNYLDFSAVGKQVMLDVSNFYDYLWQRRRGIMHLEIIDAMPRTMRAEVFYDVNKFVFDQLPLFRDMDHAFMMNLAVYVEHTFHLNGEILYKKNDTGDRMRYVLKGYLEILCEDESRVIANIRSGSAIGEIHLIHPYPHVATVRCGSDCDILVLRKSSFKQLMNSYPENWATFRERMQERFDQSELLLSLCDKHNEYPKAFRKVDERLRPFGLDKETGERNFRGNTGPEDPVENITQLVPVAGGSISSGAKNFRNMDDFDGVSLADETIQKMSLLRTGEKDKMDKPEKRQKTMEEAAFKALETDVMRAGSLAKDLGIPRPPLFLTSPMSSSIVKSNPASGTPFLELLDSNFLLLVFRIFTACVALVAIWYYLLAIAFRSDETVILTFVFHITDIIFAINFWLDMRQIVVTPQKTLENRKEILLYRLKNPSTYFGFFAFLPWEYLMTPLVLGTMHNLGHPEREFTYTCFKLNRCLEVLVIFQVIRELESMQLMSVTKMFLIKFLIATVFSIHFFAVLFRLVREYVYGWAVAVQYAYEIPLYWAAQVSTATGFGDMLYTVDLEVLTLILATIGGTVIVTYFGAKNAALLANSARRRVGFKQTYYCVKAFMRQRKFPNILATRVLDYYNLQWRAHEGTLIPTERSVVWDAPESILQSVTMEQAQTFFARVPLVQHSSIQTQQKYAKVLKQYFVPPGETVLYPYDKRRELFIIVKGFCQVKMDGVSVGTFSQGNYFGLPGLIFGVNKGYEIVSETYCLFFCLLFDDYVKLARTNHSILRDYKVFRGEAAFRKDRHKSPSESQTSASGLPEWYEKLLQSRRQEVAVPEEVASKDNLDSVVPWNVKEEEKKNLGCWRHLKCIRYLMLLPSFHPTGKFIRIWTIFRTITAVFTTIFVTAQASFAFQPSTCFFTTLVLDFVAWADMYILFHLGFYGEAGQLITDPMMTAKNYIRGSFLLDFIATFPLDYFCLPLATRNLNIFRTLPIRVYVNNVWVRRMALCRLLRSLQIYRLFLAGNIIEKFIFKSLTFITLVDVVPLMFLFMHLVTCLLALDTCNWSTGVNPDKCPETSLILNFKPLNRYPFPDGTRRLPMPTHFDIFDPFTLYITGLYWTMQTALSVGFGDFMLFDENHLTYFPSSNRIFAIAVIILGTAVSVFLGSKLTACMVGEDSRRIAIREQMKVLFDFLGQYKVPKQIQRRVREVYFNAWDKTKGISTSDLFVALHPALKADVTKQLYEVHLRKSPLLKDVDEAGIRMLSSKLREVFYPEGEYVMRQGDLNDDVFVISTGIVIAYGIGGQILSYLAPGSLFGEISALFEVQRLFSVIAATDADIFVFQREHFLEFLNMYPELRRTLENACLVHYKETMEEAALASGVEVILPVIEQLELSAETMDGSGGSEPQSKRNSASGTEGSDEASVGLSSSLNMITYKEAERNPNIIGDLLRVNLKINPGSKTGDGKEEKVEVDESYDRNSQWWSFMLTFGRIPRDEMGLIHIYQERNKCNILNFVVNPLCPLCSKATFVCISLLFTCFSCSLASFDLAFRAASQANKPISQRQEGAVLFGITLFVEFFFLVRFIGNFHLGYFDDEGLLITSNRAIIRGYATRLDGLALDVIALPYWFIAEFVYPPIGPILKGLQLIRMFLFWRYLNETESELRMKASMIKIVKISIVLCFIFHFCACFWYLIACRGLDCEEDSWMWRAIQRIKMDLNLSSTKEPEVSLGSRYFLSIFYVSTAITFTGLNYIEPAQVKEIGLTIFFIFTTVFVIGFLIGEITQCLASQVAEKIHYQHQLSVLQSHLLSLGLRRSKLKEVRSYYKLLWQKWKGIPYTQIFDEIPYPLRADIAFSIYGSNLRNSRIIGKLDDTIIRQLCARVGHEVYLPGCRIVRSGDFCDAMYFIKRGEVVILDENQNLELCVEILYENECFGEVKLLLPKEQFRFSYVARLESEVGFLRREDLEYVMGNYPILQEDLTEKAKKIKTHRTVLREEEGRNKRIELGIESTTTQDTLDPDQGPGDEESIHKEFNWSKPSQGKFTN